MRWHTWSYIPGLHWLAWVQAGIEARYSAYVMIGLVYALPSLLFIVMKTASLRVFLLGWIVSLAHAYLQKADIDRRIAHGSSSSGPDDTLMRALLRAALAHGGCLTVTQGVMATGAPFAEVERTLTTMAASGYVYTRNNPDTGVVEYVFKEMV